MRIKVNYILGSILLSLAISNSLRGQNLTSDSDTTIQNFGGPQSVAGQLTIDKSRKSKAVNDSGVISRYFDFKERTNSNTGLAYGIDYNAIIQGATASPGERVGASGAFRVFGTWNLVGRKSNNKGSLVFKVENRHRLGTNISAQGLGSEIGYAGLTSVPFSDIGWALTNFYWNQEILQNKLAFVVGVVDPADYTNVYGLVDPWNDFYQLNYSTGPTIPLPNQGLGAALRFTISDQWYLMAGISDANADPSDPGEFFSNFFNTTEYFSQVEIGWYGSYDERFSRNIHVNLWHISAREMVGTPNGWGLALSVSESFGTRFEPFLRTAYSEDGGAILRSSLAIGTGYKFLHKDNKLGIGVSWGSPMPSTYAEGLRDQYTVEVYYRTHFFRVFTITPDLQLLVNPALNLDKNLLLVYGIRGRISL